MTYRIGLLCLLLASAAPLAFGVVPVVKTVPWVAGNPGIPHDTIHGRAITVKATTDVSGTNYQYMWDFGDGTSTAWADVGTKQYNLGEGHTYTGSVGQTFTATITVRNKLNPLESGTANYFTAIRAISGPNLQVEVNMAIDRALWYMHTAMTTRAGSGGAITGYWSPGYGGQAALNTNAFLVNGHKPDPDPTNPNPYAETVMRGMNWALTRLNVTATGSRTNPHGTFLADGNGNGKRTYEAYDQAMYTTGMFVDMLVAT